MNHILTGKGYNPSCPDCRREVDVMTPRQALNLLVAAAATLESRVNRTNVVRVHQACTIWLRVNRRAALKEGA